MLKKFFLSLFFAAYLHSAELNLSGNHFDGSLMLKLISLFNVDALVETGTRNGDTAAVAAHFFREVHTIDANAKLYRKAQKRFRQSPKVHCYEGHTEVVIPKILPKMKGRILFWLTAAPHEEIKAIQNSGLRNAVILIDNVRLQPKLNELKRSILEISPDYEFWILGDIAIAYPKNGEVTASPFVKACTASRLFEGSVEDLLQQEMILKNSAHLEEARVIDAIYRTFVNPVAAPQTAYFLLWEGLLMSARKNHQEASRLFQRAIDAGCNHWRLYWYLAQEKYECHNRAAAQSLLEKVISLSPDFEEAKTYLNKIRHKK